MGKFGDNIAAMKGGAASLPAFDPTFGAAAESKPADVSALAVFCSCVCMSCDVQDLLSFLVCMRTVGEKEWRIFEGIHVFMCTSARNKCLYACNNIHLYWFRLQERLLRGSRQS